MSDNKRIHNGKNLDIKAAIAGNNLKPKNPLPVRQKMNNIFQSAARNLFYYFAFKYKSTVTHFLKYDLITNGNLLLHKRGYS